MFGTLSLSCSLYSRDSSPRKLPVARKWTSTIRTLSSSSSSSSSRTASTYNALPRDASAPVNRINPAGRKIKSVNVSFTKRLLWRIIRGVKGTFAFRLFIRAARDIDTFIIESGERVDTKFLISCREYQE